MTNDSSAGWNFGLQCSRVFALVSWGWFLYFLPDFTNAAVGFGAFLGLLASIPILALTWAGVTAGVFLPAPKPVARRWWLAANAAYVLAFVLLLTDVGLIVRVRLSEPWLAEYVQQVQEGKIERNEIGVVGLFEVSHCWEHNGAVYFFTSGCGWMDSAGVAFVPPGVEPPGRIRLLRQLYGPWHTFMEPF